MVTVIIKVALNSSKTIICNSCVISKAWYSLEFDAKKIAKNNSCVFYKQRDLNYIVYKNRNVHIGEVELFFSHTGNVNNMTTGTSAFQLFNNESTTEDPFAYVLLKNTSLLSYNIEKMHQILTLNFFRFLDQFGTKVDVSPGWI